MYTKRNLGINAIGLILIGMLTITGCGAEEAETTVQENQITVETVKAQFMDISKSATYTGTVAGKNEVNVLTEASAKITAVYVKPGDYVKAGQTIVSLDTKDYVNAVSLAENSYQQAQAALKANDVNLQTAKNTLERIKTLYENGSATLQELEQAQSAVDLLSTGASEVNVQIAETNLQTAQNQISKCTVCAPISGTIGRVPVSVGDTAGIGTCVAVISDNSQMEADITVNEADISYIKVGDPVWVYVQSSRNEPYNGMISSIDTITQTGKAGYEVKVGLQGSDTNIKSGMFAEVVLNTQSSGSALCLPVNAVITKAGQSIVYVPTDDGRVHQMTVTTGLSNDTYIEITGGINAGQEVVTSGNTLVSEGSKITILNGEAK